MDRKNATIQDVARHAKVSTATVSRALSNPESVSEKKRKAVTEAIRATGYRVNRAARNLRTQRSNTVLALLPDIANPFFSQVLQGIENVLTPKGQSLIVAETRQMKRAGEELANYLLDQRADGIIVFDGLIPRGEITAIANSPDRNRVVFACEWIEDSPLPSVRSANRNGAELAVRYLADLGHRRIAHVTGPKENVLTGERLLGYLDACHDLNIDPVVIDGNFTLEAGVGAAEQLLALDVVPTAVFCASDVVAFGVVSALSKAGLNVPGDMSVMGFDDIELCEHFIPPLTTIRQDRLELGRRAASRLLSRLRGESAPDHADVVPVRLIERSSCAAPAQNQSSPGQRPAD